MSPNVTFDNVTFPVLLPHYHLPTLTSPLSPPHYHLLTLTLCRVAFAENCHERGLLSDLEWSVYEDWHTFLLESLPLTFDAFIYLQTSPKVDVSQ